MIGTILESGAHILLSVAAIAIVFGLSFLLTGLIRKKQKKKLPLLLHIPISVGIGLLIFCVVGFGCLNVHYTARRRVTARRRSPPGNSRAEPPMQSCDSPKTYPIAEFLLAKKRRMCYDNVNANYRGMGEPL